MTALDALVIVFMVMTGVSVLGLIFMYLVKNEKLKKVVFYILSILGMAIAWMNAMSTPASYMHESIIGWGFGALSVLALLIQVCGKDEKKFQIARLMVTVSVIAGMLNLFVI